MFTTLVARQDSLGDVLLAGPAIRALAGHGRVVLLCSPAGARAAELLDGVDEVIVDDCPWITADPAPLDPSAFARSVRRLCAVGADAGVVLTSARQSALPTALMLRLASVPFVGAHSREYPGSLLDLRVRDDPPVHEVERNLRLVEAMGFVRPDDTSLRVRLPQHEPAPCPTAPFVVVHPGSSAPSRTLTVERWIDGVRSLQRRGFDVVITGLDDDRTRAVAAACPDVLDLSGRTSFVQLAAVLSRAAVVCVGNTGAMHLAAAVGTPVVACFPPTVPVEQWRPWRVAHEVLCVADVPCSPCYLRDCARDDHACAAVRGGDIADAVDALVPAGVGA